MADLSALLDKEASAEIETLLSEAQESASEILARATSEAEGIRASRKRAAEAQREAALVRARSAAQLEAASLRLRAQHEGVESAFAAVRKKLDEILADPKQYAPIFKKLLAVALEAAGAHGVSSVTVNPADRELAEASLKEAGVKAAVESDEGVTGGVRLRTGNRSLIESTLTGRLEALKGELASEVSAALFGQKAS